MNTELTDHQEFPPEKDLETLARGNNAFACDLYQHLRKQEGNLFFSPIFKLPILT